MAASAALLAIAKNNRQNKAEVAKELAWCVWVGKPVRLESLH